VRAAPRSDAKRRVLLDQRVATLERRLAATEVIDPKAHPRGTVHFGATVTVRDADERTIRYRIVGIYEADPRRGWLSWRSPLALALVGRAVGDDAIVHTPAGDRTVEIIAIEYE